MRLSDALRFSRVRQALHPSDDGVFIVGTDFGVIECSNPSLFGGFGTVDEMPWTEMAPGIRRLLLDSESWEPIDQKPDMVIVAEASSDWTNENPDDAPPLSESDDRSPHP